MAEPNADDPRRMTDAFDATRDMMAAILAHEPSLVVAPVLIPPHLYRQAEAEGIDLDGYAMLPPWPEVPSIADLTPPEPRNRAERRARRR